MNRLTYLSDDALEQLLKFLKAPEKSLLFTTGDKMLIKRMKSKIFRLDSQMKHPRALTNWQHVRELKLTFNPLASNPFLWATYVMPDLYRLEVHVDCMEWMEQIGGKALSRIFPQLHTLKFFCCGNGTLFLKYTGKFAFLHDVKSLRRLTFDRRLFLLLENLCELPPHLETLHIPLLMPFPLSGSFHLPSSLTDLDIYTIADCIPLPRSLIRLKIRLLTEHSDIIRTADPNFFPPSLRSLILLQGRFLLNSFIAMLPSSLTELSFPMTGDNILSMKYHLEHVLGLLAKTKLFLQTRGVLCFRHLPQSILTSLTMIDSQDCQFEFAIAAHLLVNLTELTMDFVSDLRYDSGDIFEVATAFPDFDMPPSLRKLSVSIRLTDLDSKLRPSAQGNIFIHRPVAKKACALSRFKFLESLEININSMYENEEWKKTHSLQEQDEIMSVIIDCIPTGLKSLVIECVGDYNLQYRPADSPCPLFARLMSKLVGLERLVIKGTTLLHPGNMTNLPSSLKHLFMSFPSQHYYPNFDISKLPHRLKTIELSAGPNDGDGVNKELPYIILEQLTRYYSKTGKRALPFLQKFNATNESYHKPVDAAEYHYYVYSRIENPIFHSK